MRPAFGEVIIASDVERLTSEQGEKAFVRLCATLVASAIGETVGNFTVPNWTERITVPDKGVDYEYPAPGHLVEAGGLVGPGRNVYQVKWRRLGTRPAQPVIRELERKVTCALKDLLSRDGIRPDRYVLLVNVDLSRSDRETISQALRKDCREFDGRPLIVWGAAEIAAALNNHPHIRHAFFSQGVFCTLENALEELRRRFELVAWVEFVGYEEQLRSIQDFVVRQGDRVLLVTGLPYSGKTRTVIEALRIHAARVAWASDPSVVTEDHLRALDIAPSKALVVVDNCDGGHLEAFERWARSRSHVKTVLISRRSIAVPDVPMVRLEGLPDKSIEAFFSSASQKVPPPVRDWIARIAGNTPGLILYGLAVQRELPEQSVLPAERERPRWVIAALLGRALLRDLPPEELNALQVLAILPQVGIEQSVKEELTTIAVALKRDPLAVRQAIPRLKEKHLLIHKGRFVEVVPELLAIDLTAEVYKAFPDLISSLWLRLHEPARHRLLRRLLELSDNPDVATLLDEIFSETGWFPTVADLRNQPGRFRTMVEARPKAALAALQRLLGGLDCSALRSTVTGDLRREVVWSLEKLALRADTFSGAATLLLRLAEAENENYGNNATGVFLELFHWRHPEASAPHPERIDFLLQAAADQCPDRRKLVAKAAGRAVAGQRVFFLHHSETISPPEEPARLSTWGDVWRFHTSILGILRELTKDGDQEVRRTAFQETLDGILEMLHLSILQDALHPLAGACFETLDELAAGKLTLDQQSKLRGTLNLIEETLHRREREAAEEARKHLGVLGARERLKQVRARIEDQSFPGRLKRWIGPRAWGEGHVGLEGTGPGYRELFTQNIVELAKEANRDPAVLDARLLDWLMTDEAKHAAPFLVALGEYDSTGSWEGPMVERLNSLNGPWAFGWYMRGVASRDRERAEQILNGMTLEKPGHVRGILSATFFLSATAGSVQRILSLVERGLASPTEVTAGIRYGGWVKPITSDVFGRLVNGLDDGAVESAAGLVELLGSWIYFSKEMTQELQEKAWRLLERSAQREDREFADSWDLVATRLAEREPERFFALFERLTVGPGGLNSAKVFAVLEDHADVWQKLLSLRRECTLFCLLGARIRGDDSPFWVSWCLQHFVDSDTDAEVLIRFATENGEMAALTVADILDADKDGFWRIAEKLIAASPDSERLASRLDSRVGTTGVVQGSLVPTWRQRLEKAARLLNHQHPRVSKWAREVVDWLEDYIRSEEKEDQERFIWDYRITRRQLEGLLQKRDSPDRLWAIRRILKRAPTKDVLELLTLEDIKEGLGTVDLAEEERKKWEAYLAHWSHRG